jgi:hypothetical protein
MAKLQAKLDSLEGLPDGIAEFYNQTESGYELAVDGLVPKDTVDQFRDNNIKLQKDNAKLSKSLQSIDVDKYNELVQKEQRMKDQELIDAGKVDELVHQRTERVRTDLEAQMNAFRLQAEQATSDAQKYKNERDSYLINTELQKAATAAGVRDTAVQDVLNRASAVWRLDSETQRLMPMQGDQVIYGKKGTALSMDEWFGDLEQQAPHLFKSSSGGGASGGVGVASRRVSVYDQTGMNNSLEAIASGKIQVSGD